MNWKFALGWSLFITLVLISIINYAMVGIETDRCHEAYEGLSIDRCDKIEIVHTLLPFTWSTKCYCENSDRIYFNMGNG